MSEMRSVETTAPDIETAIDLGLEELGVSRESVIVDILEEPSRGLLGIGARQARVRLTTAAPPRQVPASAAVMDEIEAEFEAGDEEEDVDSTYDDQPVADYDSTSTSNGPALDDADLDNDAQMGRATLEELLEKMHVNATITVHRMAVAEGDPENSPWLLQVHGDDLGVLIGRRGETLEALQYITRLIASRDLQRRANIIVDVEGYKTRREQMLHKLAHRMAEQALQTNRTVALEPMSPYERRIIHLALRNHSDVTTQSIGEGEHRKVTIIPRRA